MKTAQCNLLRAQESAMHNLFTPLHSTRAHGAHFLGWCVKKSSTLVSILKPVVPSEPLSVT